MPAMPAMPASFEFAQSLSEHTTLRASTVKPTTCLEERICGLWLRRTVSSLQELWWVLVQDVKVHEVPRRVLTTSKVSRLDTLGSPGPHGNTSLTAFDWQSN